ncbi:right-handed parallel beta-helix repeat-containing protein [Bartonella schoenbuchensis]|uniref:right-handed parallel beta-helix repeat-containing protein n=1 Tax=Bartonella schoenbuchensis TaxID=165694 RepID=UPI00314570DE
MKGTGTLTVEGGTRIQFTKDYGIKLGGEVQKAELTKVTITGSGGSGKGVWVMGGGVVMERVTITGGETGVLMEEKVTKATLTNVTIEGAEKGIAMMGSGELKVEEGTRIQFTGEYGYGVMVGDKVTSATLTDVTIRGGGSGSKGVWVKGGSLTVSGGSIGFTGTYGVMVEKGVTSATLTDVKITGSGSKGVGIYAMGGVLMVSGGEIKGVEDGIKMMGGGSLTVSGGTRIQFMGEYGYGVAIEGGATVTLTDVKIVGKGNNGSGYGVYAEGGSLTVSGGSITGVKAGIFAVGGGSLTVKDNTTINFMGSDGYGVYVGDKVRAELTGVTITGSGYGYGIEVKGGKALLEEVTIEGSGTSGTGLYMTEGTAWLKGTHLRDVAKGMTISKGVTIMEKGSVEFTRDYGIDLTRGYAFLGGVNIEGKETGQEGIRVNEGMLDLYKTNVRDVYKGMTVTKGDVVMVEGEITFKGEHGIYFRQGRAALKGITMTYKGDNRDPQGANTASPNFIKVEDGVVLAEKLTMTGNGKDNIQGVKVAKGGAVWLKKTTFSNVRSGMTVERGGIMRMEGGSITFTGGHGISVSGGQAVLSDFSITRQGDTSKATATGTGVLVSNLGKVMMRRVDISQVGMGVGMSGGLLVMDKGSITFKRDYGINLVRGHAFLNGVKITGPGSGTGIELGYGQVLIKGTTFTNVNEAITVTQGDVRMEGGEIEFKGEHGILLNQGGVALMGVTMRYKGNSTTADFIKITGEDTTNAVTTVDPKTQQIIDPNTRKIIDPKKSAVVVAASLKIDGSGHGQALNVTNGGRVVLMNPTYTNVHTGMTIEKGAVQMIEGSMEFTGGHGILLKQGHALLTNVTMEYKGHEKNTTFLLPGCFHASV